MGRESGTQALLPRDTRLAFTNLFVALARAQAVAGDETLKGRYHSKLDLLRQLQEEASPAGTSATRGPAPPPRQGVNRSRVGSRITVATSSRPSTE